MTSSNTFLLPRGVVDKAAGMFMKTDKVGASNPRTGLGPAL